MRTLGQNTWVFQDGIQRHDFLTILSEKFSIESKLLHTFLRYWYDTFDWLLFRNNKLLKREGNKWLLVDCKGQIIQTETTKRIHRTYHSFTNPSLRNILQKDLGIRALIEYGKEEVFAVEVRILNKEQKTVARVIVEESFNDRSQPGLLHVTVYEVRGYEKQFNAVTNMISGLGGNDTGNQDALITFAVQGSGRTPLDYHSGYDVPLDPSMTSSDAISVIYLSLLRDMHWNKQGVLDDIDTEFLHDLRVAVRRTRSGLTLMKNILNRESSDHFKQEFKLVGTMTGPVRDLDVYLLSEQKYRDRLPENLQEGLDYFFYELKEKRTSEQRKLARFLKSSRYQKILNEWQSLFTKENTLLTGKNNQLPIVELANSIIKKRLQRVLIDGGKITNSSPDDDLHSLRIQCKKLRYGLEFFSSLYEEQTIKKLIGRLKKLQNNLGDFNDLSVQQEMLAEYLNTLTPSNKKTKATAASIGGLMTDLAREHLLIRQQFEEKFTAFTKGKNIQLYQTLFTASP